MRNEDEEELEAIETAVTAAEQIASMSPEQLSSLKAIVDAKQASVRSQTWVRCLNRNFRHTRRSKACDV